MDYTKSIVKKDKKIFDECKNINDQFRKRGINVRLNCFDPRFKYLYKLVKTKV